MAKFTMVVWHLNHDIAIAKGLASETSHIRPYVGAICMHNTKDVEDVRQLWDARCYEPVAVIEHKAATPDEALEYAFEKTNHIDKPWNAPRARSDGVHPLHNERNRSTSVGDIVELRCYATGVSQTKVVAPSGWLHI